MMMLRIFAFCVCCAYAHDPAPETCAGSACGAPVQVDTLLQSQSVVKKSASTASLGGAHRNDKRIAGVPVLNYHMAYGGRGSLSLLESETEEEWVVVMKHGTDQDLMDRMCKASKHGCNVEGHSNGFSFMELRDTEEHLKAVLELGGKAVAYVEPDGEVATVPEMLSSGDATWGLRQIGADRRSSSGEGVNIFVLDTGIRVTHQDFDGRASSALDISTGSVVECNGDTSCARDNQGHGTHCAGSAAGLKYGVAPGAKVKSIKVLSDSGNGAWSWSYSALDWLAGSDLRPAVASMSLGGLGTLQAMSDAVHDAVQAGVTVVVAAGNENSNACRFSPAFAPSAITVGSTDSNQMRSSFSNYGECTNIWAPGSAVASAGHGSDTDEKTFSGTSMACPHVAGGAALVLEVAQSLKAHQVLEELLANARVDAISGLFSEDTNKELYVGEGGVPPTPAPIPNTWTVTGNGCVMDGDCVSSNGHPSHYGIDETCHLTINGDVNLNFEAFATEYNYDWLYAGGRWYSGNDGPGNGMYTGAIEWYSDYSITNTGWKVCKV